MQAWSAASSARSCRAWTASRMVPRSREQGWLLLGYCWAGRLLLPHFLQVLGWSADAPWLESSCRRGMAVWRSCRPLPPCTPRASNPQAARPFALSAVAPTPGRAGASAYNACLHFAHSNFLPSLVPLLQGRPLPGRAGAGAYSGTLLAGHPGHPATAGGTAVAGQP